MSWSENRNGIVSSQVKAWQSRWFINRELDFSHDKIRREWVNDLFEILCDSPLDPKPIDRKRVLKLPWYREENGFEPLLYADYFDDDLVLDLRGLPVCICCTAREIDLSRIDLTISHLEGAYFQNCSLNRARFHKSHLQAAYFNGCSLKGADFWEANLEGASFFGSDLRGAELPYSNLSFVDFFGANIVGANFDSASLEGSGIPYTCSFHTCNSSEGPAKVNAIVDDIRKNVDFRFCHFEANILDRFVLAKYRIDTRYQKYGILEFTGIIIRALFSSDPIFADVSTNDIDWSRSRRLKRFIEDQQYLKERYFSTRGHPIQRFLFYLWQLSSNCGRSFSRWLFVSLLVCVFFGFLYSDANIPGWLPQSIQDFFYHYRPKLNLDPDVPKNSYTPYYFSIVAYTTLGFGDIRPGNLPAQILLSIEVILGYLSLGALLSILADKFARRA